MAEQEPPSFLDWENKGESKISISKQKILGASKRLRELDCSEIRGKDLKKLVVICGTLLGVVDFWTRQLHLGAKSEAIKNDLRVKRKKVLKKLMKQKQKE